MFKQLESCTISKGREGQSRRSYSSFEFSATGLYRTAAGTVVQLLVPDNLRGRVTSLELYSQGFLILTSLLFGWFVDLTTVVIAIMAVGGLGLALGAISLFTLPRVRQLN